MRSFERRSIFTFSALYLGGIALISALIFWWYWGKETHRINQEQKMALKLYDIRCKRLLKNAPKDFKCPLKKPDFSHDFDRLYHELFIAAMLVLLLGTLLSIRLAYISLRPMREAVEMMDNFARSMIHDLNTPITTARLNAAALKKQNLSQAQTKRVDRIIQSLQMLQSLEAQLRSVIGHAKTDFHDQKLSLCELCETLKERSKLIKLECANEIIVNADKIMITRALDNLLSNAIKYNKNDRPIEIKLSGSRLSIVDHGQGIAHPKRIFEPYYREKSSMPGLGLGLGIVKEVCDRYGITLDFQSKLGKGTTVTLDFSPILFKNR